METRSRAAALKRQADGNTESPAKKKRRLCVCCSSDSTECEKTVVPKKPTKNQKQKGGPPKKVVSHKKEEKKTTTAPKKRMSTATTVATQQGGPPKKVVPGKKEKKKTTTAPKKRMSTATTIATQKGGPPKKVVSHNKGEKKTTPAAGFDPKWLASLHGNRMTPTPSLYLSSGSSSEELEEIFNTPLIPESRAQSTFIDPQPGNLHCEGPLDLVNYSSAHQQIFHQQTQNHIALVHRTLSDGSGHLEPRHEQSQRQQGGLIPPPLPISVHAPAVPAPPASIVTVPPAPFVPAQPTSLPPTHYCAQCNPEFDTT